MRIPGHDSMLFAAKDRRDEEDAREDAVEDSPELMGRIFAEIGKSYPTTAALVEAVWRNMIDVEFDVRELVRGLANDATPATPENRARLRAIQRAME